MEKKYMQYFVLQGGGESFKKEYYNLFRIKDSKSTSIIWTPCTRTLPLRVKFMIPIKVISNHWTLAMANGSLMVIILSYIRYRYLYYLSTYLFVYLFIETKHFKLRCQ